ncbi:transposase [Streptomyces sp. NPDC002125]
MPRRCRGTCRRPGPALPSSSPGRREKTPGRKRHIVTDTLGRLPAVAVTAAKVGDRDAVVPLLRQLRSLQREIVRSGAGFSPYSSGTGFGAAKSICAEGRTRTLRSGKSMCR